MNAFRLHTGPNGDSLIQRIDILRDAFARTESIQFRETAPRASKELHTAPVAQYVIMLSGRVEFIVESGETFTVHPGDVLLVEDTTGSGHGWRVMGSDPWMRACVVFANGNEPQYRAVNVEKRIIPDRE